ncbi:MAG: hypothetical protein QHD01_05535 [Bradyrhizobium sp.]|uniref:hypothetical protein n=1 Tax=Bradyrhizobium sp. TaxID=376 RepID=UPI0029B02E51|nr:hypothetical protein [Bradyrhizobium sp.]MDX3966046.1 hypothetical protein [Bradyrhizobium sp.]
MKANIFLTFCILIGGIAWYVSDHSKPSFSKSGINSIREDIRSEFSKRDGVRVIDVSLIQESERRLEGFVKLQIDKAEITKDCSASMSMEDGRTIWGCR